MLHSIPYFAALSSHDTARPGTALGSVSPRVVAAALKRELAQVKKERDSSEHLLVPSQHILGVHFLGAKPDDPERPDLFGDSEWLIPPSSGLGVSPSGYHGLFCDDSSFTNSLGREVVMPLHMETMDVSADLAETHSVLIVSCPICPPISLAMQKDSPFLEVFRSGLNTGAFEDHIRSIRLPLEARGVKTGVYRSYLPSPTMCLWTKGQRGRFRQRAQDYETVVVLGCNTARYTVESALGDTDCKVVQAMRTVGMTNAALKIEFPLTIKLEDKVRIGAGDKVEPLA